MLIGAPWRHGATDAGSAYLYDANTGALLRTFNNPTPANNDWFGFSVAGVGADKVLIGAVNDSTGAFAAGSAYLYDANTGTLLFTINNPTPEIADDFGVSVAAVGADKVLIGADSDNTGATDAGSAYLYDANTGTLLRTFNNPTPASGDTFGHSVAAVGADKVLIGAYQDNTGASHAGSAYLYDANTGALLLTFNNPTPASGDGFGFSVAAVGADKVLIGANTDNSGANLAGSAFLFDIIRQVDGIAVDASNISNGKIANNLTTGTNNNTVNTLVLRDASGNFSAGTIIANLTGNASTATNFTGSLAGEVTGPQGSTVVFSVGGVIAANVASGANLANGATTANTPNAIVKRDGSGNFSSTGFSGSLAGDVTGIQASTVVASVGGVTAANVASGANLANGATTANTPNAIVKRDGSGNFSSTGFSGSLAGDVTGIQASTVVASVGGVTAANVASGANLANTATTANTPNLIVKRDGSGNFIAGTITASLSGNASTAGSATNFSGQLAGEVTGPQTNTSLVATAVTSKPLTGFSSTTGTVTATDSLLSAIDKLYGNDALKAPLASPSFTGAINIPATTSATSGVIQMAGTPIISAPGTQKVFFGNGAGNFTFTGNQNTGVGVVAMNQMTAGNHNSGVGYAALYTNSGSENTGMGYETLYFNTGNFNTATGYEALFNNTGNGNTGDGYQALFNNTSGTRNTSDGYQALLSVVTGNDNTAQGYQALQNNTGDGNTAAGASSLAGNTTGFNNTATGSQALSSNTTASNNVATGESALRTNTTGNNNTAIGTSALRNNNGSSNTATGTSALTNNTAGSSNTATGTSALTNNTTGSSNTATGTSALAINTTGLQSTAVGASALAASNGNWKHRHRIFGINREFDGDW